MRTTIRRYPLESQISLVASFLLVACAAGAVVGLSTAVGAQTLLRDFNTTPKGVASSSWSSPLAVASNGRALFAAQAGVYGEELWSTDGTYAGTELLADIQVGYQGSSPRASATLPSGLVLFVAWTSQFGHELWRTDGTSSGTVLVRDIAPGPSSSSIVSLMVVGNQVAFFATDFFHGVELWRSDGTTAGTAMVRDIHPLGGVHDGSGELALLGTSEVLFGVRGGGGVWELWRSDLTLAGTTKVDDLPPAAPWVGPTAMRSLGARVLFAYDPTGPGGVQAWASDGTAANTFALGVSPRTEFQVVGARAFFEGSDRELWVTDGTATGSRLAVDLTPASSDDSMPAFVGAIGNRVVFSAFRAGGRRLYASDGTLAGTQLLANVEAATSVAGRVDAGVSSGGFLWFEGVRDGQKELWRTDGTVAGTVFVNQVESREFLPFQNGVLFQGADLANGAELWAADAAGARIVCDLTREALTFGSSVDVLATFRDQVVLRAAGDAGQQFWLTDGTPANTRPISSFPSGGVSFSLHATSTDDYLFLQAFSSALPHEVMVFGSSGVLEVLPISTNYPGFQSRMLQPVALRNQVVFAGGTPNEGIEPWISDGTLAGTRPILDLRVGAGHGCFGAFYTWRDRVYFLGKTSAAGSEPWSTDGTAAGTSLVVDSQPGTAGVSSILWIPTPELLFFRMSGGSSPANLLWRTDGTAAGTYSLDLTSLGVMSLGDVHPVDGELVFSFWDGSANRIARTDGTLAGTQILSQPTGVQGFTRIRDDLLLTPVFNGVGYEYWVTDGTVAGTQSLGAAFAGGVGSFLASPARDTAVLSIDDPVFGQELFATDGTVAGSRLLFDFAPGNSFVSQLTRAGTRVVFIGDDGIHGRELFAFDLSLLQDEAVATYGYGCAALGASPPTLAVAGDANASGSAVDLIVEGGLPNAAVLFGLAEEGDAVAVPGSACRVWLAGAPTVVFATADAQGRASLAVPVTPALFGARFVAQGFAVDPAGPLLGFLAATAGLEVVLGP
ncbi:MAG: hypothetical protein AB8H80_00790 [Planctomycetota bacterium]